MTDPVEALPQTDHNIAPRPLRAGPVIMRSRGDGGRRPAGALELVGTRAGRTLWTIVVLAAIAGASIPPGTALATDTAMRPEPVAATTSAPMTIVLPETVQKYVRTHRPLSIAFDGEPMVGASLPADARLRDIPGYQFQYVYVNGKPVFVDGQSRRIVHVVQ